MTCYESLVVQETGVSDRCSSGNAPMANHLVKWWKSKFRNGYKQFSVLGSGERTDTEELVGRTPSQCSAPPDLLPSEARALLAPSPSERSERRPAAATQPQPPSDRLRFEELTCDVQVQDGISGVDGQQPLQFSFTLYDFDGHGRMTKDDIAGIVSTIYESVGKTVTVPHYGSKTIQVRLTVSPEQRKLPEKKSEPNAGGSPERGQNKTKTSCKCDSRCISASRECSKCQNSCPEHKVRFKRDPHAQHVREGRRKPRRRRETCTNIAEPYPARVEASDEAEDERRSRLSIDDDVSECSADLPRALKRTPRHRHYLKNNLSPRYRNEMHTRNHLCPNRKDSASPSPQRVKESDQHCSRTCEITYKKRSSSLQRQELLEIIQANMEKNHLSFQTSRKPFEQRGVSSLEGERTHNKNRYRNRSYTFSDKPSSEPFHLKNEQHSNGYLDLANANPNIIAKDTNLCRYDSFLHAVICSTAQYTSAGGSQHKSYQANAPPHQKPVKAHHRSRSHDLAQGTFRYTLLEPFETDCASLIGTSKETNTSVTDNKNVDLKENHNKNANHRDVNKLKNAEQLPEKEISKKNNLASDSKNKIHSHRSDVKAKLQENEFNSENLRKVNLNCKKLYSNHSCSPHHLKHQNREKYHARAMAQVEKWLEADNNTRLKSNKFKKFEDADSFPIKSENLIDCNEGLECRGLLKSSEQLQENFGQRETSSSPATGSTVHRCVHEHIHHHYVHCSH